MKARKTGGSTHRPVRASTNEVSRPGITMVADDVRDRLAEIGKSLDELQDRLFPVLTPEGESAIPTDDPPTPLKASLRNVLEHDEQTARELNARIQALIGRVDL